MDTTSIRNTAVDLTAKLMNASHRVVLAVTGGRVLSTVGPMPVAELCTIGRKSGRRRTTLLTSPLQEGDRIVFVASKGGDDRDPDWYRNLVATPDVEVTIHGETKALRARTASPEEKAELWPRIVASYKGYDGYQKRTRRDIPVVICEPATHTGDG